MFTVQFMVLTDSTLACIIERFTMLIYSFNSFHRDKIMKRLVSIANGLNFNYSDYKKLTVFDTQQELQLTQKKINL